MTGADPNTAALLDRASGYDLHQGPMTVPQRNPGDFWSIECIDLYKSFGPNRVMNGLTSASRKG
jgi:phospholipid/cholesterol/gamma-HCH transport system ATP-binding protein